MKKFLQLFMFCFLANATWANEGGTSTPTFGFDVQCDVSITWDSINTGVALIATPTGTAPFTYLWNTGETTPTLETFDWGVNYCVTVTDANGCVAENCLFNQNSCVIYSYTTNIGVAAYSSGLAPFTYLWSTGQTTESIQTNTPGSYCVTVTDAVGCTGTSCSTFSIPCHVSIEYDSLNSGSYFTAEPSGVAPFSYQWNTGETTQSISIDPPYFGDYCVVVTDAVGCSSSDCVFLNSCSVTIVKEGSGNTTTLHAVADSPGSLIYSWSTGETTSSISPTGIGTYCVTVTGGGCIAEDCYYYTYPNNFNISGYLYLPDSLNAPLAPMVGIVELFFNSPNADVWEPMGTVNIQSDANGWSNYYNFGPQTNGGNYIVKATLDPSYPTAGDYMPTYHHSTVLWDEANQIVLPSNGFGLFNIIFSDGQNLTTGSGNINGVVTEGEGVTANEEDNRSGTPRPNTSVLLFDSNELPITHTLTDDLGRYSFANLPYGTYKIMVEIVGQEQAYRWVTLSGDNPTSTGNDFQVTESGIVLSIGDVLVNASFEVFPNPTSGTVSLNFESLTNFDAQFSIARPDGKVVMIKNQQVVKGAQTINLDLASLPTGLYLLNLTTDSGVLSTKIMKR